MLLLNHVNVGDSVLGEIAGDAHRYDLVRNAQTGKWQIMRLIMDILVTHTLSDDGFDFASYVITPPVEPLP